MFKGVLAAGAFLSVMVFSSVQASNDMRLHETIKTFAGYEAVYDVTVQHKDSVKSFSNGKETVRQVNGCGGFSENGNLSFALENAKGGRLISDNEIYNTEFPQMTGYRFSSVTRINSKPGPAVEGTALLLGMHQYVVHYENSDRAIVEIPGNVRFPTALDAEIVTRLQDGKQNLTTLAFDAHSEYPVKQVKVKHLPQRFMPALFRQDPGFEVLKDLQGWMVDMSFHDIDESQKVTDKPDSRIVKDLYENGISRNIRISYPNINMVFRLTSVTWLPDQECE